MRDDADDVKGSTPIVAGRVSIVIPCFNDDPAHLLEAVHCALHQTYADVEVVLVDDGSTRRETTEILAKLGSSVVLVRQENAGTAAARNAGVRASTGEYVQLLDADDWLDAHFVAEAVHLLSDPSIQIACSAIRLFGMRNSLLVPKRGITLKELRLRNEIGSASMVRRARWEEVGGQWEPLREGFEDWEFWIRILRDGGTAEPVPSAEFHYRVREGSRSRTASPLARAKTREAVVAANADDLAPLLKSSLEVLDLLELSHVRDATHANRWRRATAPLRWVRGVIGARNAR